MGWLNTSGVTTFDVIIEVESEHHVRLLDNPLREPRFQPVSRRVSADTSLTKTG